jgi:hypothetical protein
MDIKEIIRSQYRAALEMLGMAVTKCPQSLWNDPADKNKFWHIAYHALFYTHLYLAPSDKEFAPWVKHYDQYTSLKPKPSSPDDKPQIEKPYTKEEILEYLAVCRQQVEEKVAAADLEAESGFFWLPFSKLELQIYNIRHLQQHTGELMERLGTREHIDIDWVGMKS